MANFVWYNIKKTESIEEPFLSYRNKKDTRNFQKWLLYGYKNGKDGNDTHYGSHTYGNVLEQVMSAKSNSDISKGQNLQSERQYLDLLNNLYEQLQQAEQSLYKHFKNCRNFSDFSRIWDGVMMTQEQDVENYWLNKMLELFVGEKQRLIGSKERTLIEQLFSLMEIRLDKMNMYGIEDVKNKFKDRLVEDGLLEIVEADEKVNYDRYVERKSQEETEADFIDKFALRLIDYIDENENDKIAEEMLATLDEFFGEKKGDITVYSKDRVRGRFKRRISAKKENIITVKAMFTSWPSKDKRNQGSIINTFLDFIRRSMAVTLSNEEYDAWEKYQNKATLYTKMEKMMAKYFSTHNEDYSQYSYNVNNISAIQGLMGEIASFGRSEFNLKSALKNSNEQMNIINLGTLINQKGWSSGVDMAITFDAETYGFQVKNPFNVNKDGKYSTYKQTWNLGRDKSISTLYNDYFNFTDDQRQLFEMLNVNLNTTINPEALEFTIIKFLYYFSNEFIRLNTEEINKNVEEQQEDNLKDLQNVRNIFFVLKGKLIQSSALVQGLIEQYKFFKENYGNNVKDSNSILDISYTNTVKANIITSGEESKPGAKFNRNLIETGSEYENELSKIYFSTALKLQIPGLTHFMNKKG